MFKAWLHVAQTGLVLGYVTEDDIELLILLPPPSKC